jgi:CDP-diacylglycerol--serine O-phosphatidyltransferase
MKTKKYFENEKIRRTIYVLPNIFTSINMFCGFFAIISAINGNFKASAISIIIAGIFDLLDGKIARATNTTSKFGLEYDSLSDLVSFGVAPAIMVYLWALQDFGRLGWLECFLFMICGALRLARFNCQAGTISSDYFIGLPIPAAAGMNSVIILFFDRLNIQPIPMLSLIGLYVLSFLMVSAIKFNSFKNAGFFKKTKFNFLVSAVLILIFIAAQPAITLFILGCLYITSGPVLFVVRKLKLHHKHKKEQSAIT